MKSIVISIFTVIYFLLPSFAFASKEKRPHSGVSEEKKEHAHEENENHDHGKEENEQVGPGKGIVSASEEKGIQISSEAEKNFEIKRILFSSPLEIPKDAIVTSGLEVNIYRYREGYYKRIDFSTLKTQNKKIWISSVELKAGDEVVVHGIGLLRIAEIAAFGGAPEGHSH